MPEDKNSYFKSMYFDKDLSRVKTDLKSIPLQLYFEISRLASTEKWQEIQNLAFKAGFYPVKIFRFDRFLCDLFLKIL